MDLQVAFSLGFVRTIRALKSGFLLTFEFDVLLERLPVSVISATSQARKSSYKKNKLRRLEVVPPRGEEMHVCVTRNDLFNVVYTLDNGMHSFEVFGQVPFSFSFVAAETARKRRFFLTLELLVLSEGLSMSVPSATSVTIKPP